MRRLAWLPLVVLFALLSGNAEAQVGQWVVINGSQTYTASTSVSAPAVVIQQNGAGAIFELRKSDGSSVCSVAADGTASGCFAGGGGGGGAPTTAQYWTGAADGTLSAEKNLGALATALVINTGGVPSAYGGVTCTNQVISALSAVGAGTCRTIALATDVSGTLQAAQEPAHTGDVTNSAGSLALTLANIPSATPMAGSVLATAIAAPGTPAAGKGSIYVDSASKNLAVKDDAGVVKHGVQTNTGASNNFVTAIADDGTVSRAQPAFTNLSGAVAASQMPALTGDVTTSAGAVATTIGAGKVLESMLGLTDLTTANASTSAHGFAPKLDNNSAHFLNGQGAWTTPGGGGGSGCVTSGSATQVVTDDGANGCASNSGLTFASSVLKTPTLNVANGTAGALQGEFSVYSTASTLPRGISNIQNSADTTSASFAGYKSRGTAGSESIITTGDLLSVWRSFGYDGGAYVQSASIQMVSTGTIASTRVAGMIDFFTGTDAAPTVLTRAMRIDQAQRVGIGTGTSALTSTLTVSGTDTANSYAAAGTAGAGFLELLTQSSAPSAPASGYRLYADSTGRVSWIRQSDGFTRTFDAALSANRVWTLQDVTDTFVFRGTTDTLTNKRMTRRSSTTNAPGATPTINTDNVDLQIYTGVGAAITSMQTNRSGTATAGDLLEIDFTDDGTARAITWGAAASPKFKTGGIATLPTTTVISTVLRVFFEFDGTDWICVGVA